MEEKLSIISYNNPKELLNHRSEVLNICKHRKNCLLGWQIYLCIYLFFLLSDLINKTYIYANFIWLWEFLFQLNVVFPTFFGRLHPDDPKR